MVAFSEKENIGGLDLNREYQDFNYGRFLSHIDELILMSESIC